MAAVNASDAEAPALTRNERKRRYREAQQQAANGNSNGTALSKKPHRMPASAFLPLAPEDAPATRFRRCVIEYDGSQFNGFQAQEKRDGSMRTVQETVEDALLRTTSERIRLRAASRTDKGVHARGQVVVFASRCVADDRVFRDALNNRLPDDVLCRQMVTMPSNADATCAFDPRAHSIRKVYAYEIVNGGLRPVLDRHRIWFVKKPLDVARMQAAAQHFVNGGAQDYSSFTPKASNSGTNAKRPLEEDDDDNAKGNMCTLTSIMITPSDSNEDSFMTEAREEEDKSTRVHIVFTGDRFLYKMVRNLVGTLVDVGLGRISPEQIPGILAAKNRGKAGQGAPPQGLTLVCIEYPPS
uniref:tRNA pseudouridine synthase n=1 Tax=Globisporangium ultimum (strain ATCC 200006 / CBS 805.95 / DAOM BR144) TaxID=431595 RepID=K3X4W0_GLOUD